MSAILLLSIPGLVGNSNSVAAAQHLGARSDSLVLAVLGIAFLLLSVLARGFSHAWQTSEQSEEDAQFAGSPRVAVVAAEQSRDALRKVALYPLLSVDVEDYFQTEAMSSVVSREDWNQYPLRVVDNTKRLLDLFDEYNAKATFFTLGWIADQVPSLLREIAARGHELACHSYWHRLVYTLSEEEFRRDTLRAIAAIEDAAGLRVEGYRAPTWSITSRSIWALRALMETGFTYDSSIYPVHRDLYGVPGALPTPHMWRAGAGELLEIPPATLSLGEWRVPAAGGGYLRMFPARVASLAIDQLKGNYGLPLVYLHPWEVDPDQPRLNASFKSRFRQYVGLHSLESKLRHLLSRYQFVPFRDCCMEAVVSAPRFPIALAGMAVQS